MDIMEFTNDLLCLASDIAGFEDDGPESLFQGKGFDYGNPHSVLSSTEQELN